MFLNTWTGGLQCLQLNFTMILLAGQLNLQCSVPVCGDMFSFHEVQSAKFALNLMTGNLKNPIPKNLEHLTNKIRGISTPGWPHCRTKRLGHPFSFQRQINMSI